MVTTNLTPTNQRISSIDIIRGIAIMGIFLINIQSFLLLAGQEELIISKVDKWGYQIIDMLALGKFHFIFAFLFGVGASIFFTRLSQKNLVNGCICVE
ncbi:hypothetical protein LZ480_14685 [Solibacillus sp. MA9]|uniref:Heparan-alpha-glucosaminide N-acetyltransferase catalytic domain-containing protein n=1 Tax=Solibacillus palustris TaxID=2908203 RepID=A0ABS9UGP4_9BACL|nr:hypothetical protein [Solibacillus sp. MA9]MCH7323123.1 hypothetical protein [Solibacillus sp. MA9]